MRLVKFLPLVLLGFSVFCPGVCPGANVCSDCAQQYATVRAQAVIITNNLENLDSQIQTAIYRNQYISSQVANIRSWYSQTGTAIPSSVESACRNADDYVLQNNSTLTTLRDSVSSSYSAALSQLSTLDSFNCSCSSNSCGCASILSQILTALTSVKNNVDDYLPLIEESTFLIQDDVSYMLNYLRAIYFKSVNKDDDYLYDLNQIAQGMATIADRPLTFPSTLANSRFSTDAYRNNVELGIGYLYSVDYQNMCVNQKSSETLNEILSVISNISVSVTNSSSTTGKWEADLAFISNYLYTIQRRYFETFNNDYLFRPGSATPVSNANHYRSITNAWAVMRDPSATMFQKQSAFGNLRGYGLIFTNWFERIEFALYGIAGFWDSNGSFDSSLSRAGSITNNFDRLISSTNSFSLVSSVFSVSNQAQTVISEFKNLVDAFDFSSSSVPSATLTLCPSFQIGDFEFSGIAFEMYDIHEVLEAIRTAFQFVWTIGFSFFGIALAAKFFFYLGKAIRDVFILLKTLL